MPAPGCGEKVEGSVCSRAVSDCFLFKLDSRLDLCLLPKGTICFFCFVLLNGEEFALSSSVVYLIHARGPCSPLPPEDKAVAESQPLFPLKSSGI